MLSHLWNHFLSSIWMEKRIKNFWIAGFFFPDKCTLYSLGPRELVFTKSKYSPWCVKTCSVTSCFLENCFPHCSQGNGFIFKWEILMCIWRVEAFENCLLQYLQNNLDPVARGTLCALPKWWLSWDFKQNFLSHSEQG